MSLNDHLPLLDLRSEDWLPFGVGAALHLIRIYKNPHRSEERFSKIEIAALLAYSAYQGASIYGAYRFSNYILS